jgi:hypothetical protein
MIPETLTPRIHHDSFSAGELAVVETNRQSEKFVRVAKTA